MLFVDQAKITVKAGDGGRGCSAYSQPPYVRSPYPDGGNGGKGGDVIIQTDHNIATLLDFQFRHEFKGGRGGHGSGSNKTGKHGQARVVLVPVGTVIHSASTGQILRDLSQIGESVIMAKGGRGGYGNANKAEAQPGIPGEQRKLILELKLIAEVGLVGFPNAGKSSLLARITTAKPKVGAYPFTTRYPVLGVVRVGAERSFVACDIPGLIEGAHTGRGLGMQFLRHVERTRLLAHLIDMGAVDGRNPIEAYEALNAELAAYSPVLGDRPQLVLANKMDLPEAKQYLEAFRRKIAVPILPISCATGEGVQKMLTILWQRLQELNTVEGKNE